MTDSRPVVFFLCTGNAARSPMAAAMLRTHDVDGCLDVRSAGCFVVEGQPMSVRTRAALAGYGLVDHAHRSHQFNESDAKAADLIAVMEPAHVKWMRARFPAAAAVTASLRRLARDLPAVADQVSTQQQVTASPVSLRDRVASLDLDSIMPEAWEEVADPGSGEQPVYHDCASELVPLVSELYRRLLGEPD